MKTYGIALTFLALVFVGLLAVASSLRSDTQAVHAANIVRKADIQATGATLRELQSKRDSLDLHAAVNESIEQWNAPVELARSDRNVIMDRVAKLVQSNYLATETLDCVSRDDYLYNGQNRRVSVLKITVSGDYHRCVNWMGQLESEFVLGRVDKLTMRRLPYSNSSAIRVDVDLVLPQFELLK